ncbi:MAG TPA: hypothetical protein VF530_23160 [Planctomycetota bacterium]
METEDESVRSQGTERRGLRLLRGGVRGLLLLWAAFWAWFVVVVSLGEAPAPPWWIPAAWLASLAGLVVLCWRWPGLGGALLLAAGLWSGAYFANGGARALLAAPAVALGLACLAQAFGSRFVARAAVVLLGLTLTGCACLVPQDPADAPYRTGSFLRHPDGSLRRAYLLEETELEGLACRGWVWWYEDGRLDNLELAHERVVQGHAFPAGTRLFLDREGRLAHAWLARTTQIDGLPCRGKWKIDTAFHPNGHVKAFFPPEDHEIDGFLCTASVFHPVYLHPDGRLRQCKLARAATIGGRTFRAGAKLTLDEAGRPVDG